MTPDSNWAFREEPEQLDNTLFRTQEGRIIRQSYTHAVGNEYHSIQQNFIPKGPNGVYKNLGLREVNSGELHPWISTVSCWVPQELFVEYKFVRHDDETQRKIEIYNPFKATAEYPIVTVSLEENIVGEFYPKPKTLYVDVSDFSSSDEALRALRMYADEVLADRPQLVQQVQGYKTNTDTMYMIHHIDPQDQYVRRKLAAIPRFIKPLLRLAYGQDGSEESKIKQSQLFTFLLATGFPGRLVTEGVNWRAPQEDIIKDVSWRIMQHIHEFTERIRPSEFLIAEFAEDTIRIATPKMSDIPIYEEEAVAYKAQLPKETVAYDTPIVLQDGYTYSFHREGKAITGTLTKAGVELYHLTFADVDTREFDRLMTGIAVDYGELLTSAACIQYTSPLGEIDTKNLLSQ